jgi:hypothetical protein
MDAGAAAPVFQGCAHLFDGQGCPVVRAGDIVPFDIVQVVGVEFRLYAVQNFVWVIDYCHF